MGKDISNPIILKICSLCRRVHRYNHGDTLPHWGDLTLEERCELDRTWYREHHTICPECRGAITERNARIWRRDIMLKPNRIIIHHSATKDSGTVSWNAIRRYHINECVWRDIGYHFGIEHISDPGDPKGSYEILIGRMPDTPGAHTTGQNNHSLGICFVGNFDEASPPPDQWKKGVALVKWLCELYAIPTARIYGHRDFAKKTCPGKLFDLDAFRVAVEAG